jgi:hypothetical protein
LGEDVENGRMVRAWGQGIWEISWYLSLNFAVKLKIVFQQFLATAAIFSLLGPWT